MAKRPVRVWIQRFSDRKSLVLQWFCPITGKRKSRSAETSDPEQAEIAREKLQYELRNDKFQEASNLSWAEFRQAFEEECFPNYRPNTRRRMRVVLRHFEAICNPRKVQAIDAKTMSAFVAGMRKRKGRPGPQTMASTIALYLSSLHKVLSWAVKKDALAAVPEFPEVEVPVSDPPPVPAESFECLYAKATDPQMKAFLLCGWRAGLRLNEAFQLEREPTDKAPWLDVARKRIWIPRDFSKAKVVQWVPLDAMLAEALQALPQHGRKVFHFMSKRGTRPLTVLGVCCRIGTLAKKAGVRLTMKSLRKGFGSYYAHRVSAHVLQKLMRHADIKTTMRYYVNIDTAVEQAVQDRNDTLAVTSCNVTCYKSASKNADNQPGSDVTPHGSET
jgi:integrase